MFDRQYLQRNVLFPLGLMALVALAACEHKPPAAHSPDTLAAPNAASVNHAPLATLKAPLPAPSSNPTGAAIQAKAVAPRELRIEALAGGWRVVAVVNAAGKSASQAQAIQGAIAEVYPESLRWSYQPAGATGLNDYCQAPVAGIVLQAAALANITADFTPAQQRLKIAKSQLGHPHEWLCSGGGSWGPSDQAGADFVLVGKHHMLMRWQQDTVLYLEKLRRVAPKANMQGKDYLPVE